MPQFDPSLPFEVVDEPRFDPSQPFETVEEPRFDPNQPFEEVTTPSMRLSVPAPSGTQMASPSPIPLTQFAAKRAPTVLELANLDPLNDDLFRKPLTEEQEQYLAEGLPGALMRPIAGLEIPRMEASDIAEFLPIENAKLKEDVSQVLAGVGNTLGGFLNFADSPVGLTMGVAAAAGGAIGLGAISTFFIDSIRNTPNLINDVTEAVKSGDGQRITEASSMLAGNTLIAIGTGLGLKPNKVATGIKPSEVPSLDVKLVAPKRKPRAKVEPTPATTGSTGQKMPVDYQYASPESKAWWEKKEELQSKYDALNNDPSTEGSPERAAARKALNDHGDLAYTPEGREAGLSKRRIDKSDPLNQVNSTVSQYIGYGQQNLTGFRFNGDWTAAENGRLFRKVVSSDGKTNLVVWKETLHPLEEAALNKNTKPTPSVVDPATVPTTEQRAAITTPTPPVVPKAPVVPAEPTPAQEAAPAATTVLTETTGDKFQSKRKVTQEGVDRVEAAKNRLRDIINNPDIVGKQRADMISDGRNLIAFLETHADTRKPLDTGFEFGDKVAYTGEDAPEGFRAFIWLEGHRGGRMGVSKIQTVKDSLTVAAPDAAATPATTGATGQGRLISENQIVGTEPGWFVVRDLYESADGVRHSVRKSGSFEERKSKGKTPEQLIAEHPLPTPAATGATGQVAKKFTVDSPEVKAAVEETPTVQALKRKLGRAEADMLLKEQEHKTAQRDLSETSKLAPNYSESVRNAKRAKSFLESARSNVDQAQSQLNDERTRKAPFVRMELNKAAAPAAPATTGAKVERPASEMSAAERALPAGQKKMASEAASVATVSILNKKVREKSPSDAWHDTQIEDATGNQSLLNSIRDDLLPIYNRLYAKPASPSPAQVAKEPWEMTLREYEAKGVGLPADHPIIAENSLATTVVREAEQRLLTESGFWKKNKVPDLATRRTTIGALHEVQAHTVETALRSPKVSREAKDAYRAAKKVLKEISERAEAITNHKNIVLGALREGKPVPPEVLAEHGLEKKVEPVIEQTISTEPEIIGMGGAVPSEFESSFRESTGIKKAEIEKARAERAVEPIDPPTREAQEEVHTRVTQKVDLDPGYLDRLVDELAIEPRPINADEVVALDMRYVELQAERAKALRQGEQAFEDGRLDDVAAIQGRVQMWEEKLNDFERMVRKSGTLWGRTGAIMQRTMKADFSLAAMEQRARADKGFEPLTPDEREQIKKDFEKIEAQSKAFEDRVIKLDQEKSDAEARAAFAELRAKNVPQFHPSVLDYAEKFVSRMEVTSKKLLKEILGATWSPTPDVLLKMAFIGATKLARIGLDVTKWTNEMVRDIGERFRPFAEQVYEMSKKTLEEQLNADDKVKRNPKIKEAVKRVMDDSEKEADIVSKIEAKFEQGKNDQISGLVNQLARLFVKQGTKKIEPLLKKIHDVIKEINPDITLRETQDALTGYGKFTVPKQDAVSKIVADLKGQALELGKIEDIESGKPLKKTGFLRGMMSAGRRRLVAKVNEWKRKFGVVTTDPETQLASALDSRKTYYKNQNADLSAQIKSKQKFLKTRTPSPTDTELKKLIAENVKLKAEFDYIFGDPKLTNEQRLARAIAVAERTEKQWVQRLENAKKGKFGLLKEPSKKVESLELKAIQARTEASREQVKELKDLANPKKTPEQIALQTLKARMRSRIADFEERTANGDFETRKREPLDISKDPEAVRLAAEVKRSKTKFEQRRERWRLQQRSVAKVVLDSFLEVMDVIKNNITSVDVSAVLRQAFFATVAHPVKAVGAVGKMFKALISQRQAERIQAGIELRPNAELYKKSGLRIVDLNARLNKQEEAARGRWANAVPWIRSSNRAFVTYLNVLRAESFDVIWKSLPDQSIEAAKALAEGVNDMTGFGSVRKSSNFVDAAARIIWSPRLLLSRFNVLFFKSLRKGPWEVRKAFAKEYAKILTGIAAIYALGKMNGATVEDDPRSSDFGKMRWGKTRLDPLAGISQITVFLARLGSGSTKTLKGEIVPIRGKVKFGHTSAEVIADFLRTKLRPEIGAVVDALSGENVIGQKVTPESLAVNLLTPLSLRDIYNVMIDNGVPRGTALEILSQFGMGVQTFENRKKGK